MAKITNQKRIVKEDFDAEYHDLIDKLSYAINPVIEQLASAFNKNITIENLSREIITVTVENKAGGDLKIPVQIKTGLAKVQGIKVIRADNLTNITTYPVNAPFISWTLSTNIITVKKITGIQDDNKYNLTLEIIN